MNSKINRGRIQFNDENYENALFYFEAVDEEDEDYDYVLMFKITCLMELGRYDKALFLIDSLLGEDCDDELLLYEKIRCHIALDEKQEALDALKKFEKIISHDNKQLMLDVARFYNILGDFQRALKFCDGALKIDGGFEDALFEKALISIALEDDELINQCADKLFELADNDEDKIGPIFLLKLYSRQFGDCFEIIEGVDGTIDNDMCEMLKIIVFNLLYDSLGVNIHFTEDVELSIDEAIQLLLDYDENGIKCGLVNDVGFVII